MAIELRSNREIRLMRKAGLVVWQAHQQVAGLIRPGVSTRRLDEAVEEVFRQADAIPLFKGVPGEVPFPASTCISINEQVVHGMPGDRILKEGDVVSVDTGCKVNGWCGDAAATYPVGRISPKIQALLDTTRRVLDLAIELMAEKQWWSQVAREMARTVRNAGYSLAEGFSGHGIGREMHEDPVVPNHSSDEFRQDGDFRIRPGLVIAIEPMVNLGTGKVEVLADHWTQVTVDRKPSAHFEHTVAMTKEGPKSLTAPPEGEGG